MKKGISLALLLLLLGGFLLSGCGAADLANVPGSADNTPCSCKIGEKRCIGAQIQVCEQVSATCSEWGAPTDCPGHACESNTCNKDCRDLCTAGSGRCAGDATQQTCRIGASGCLEWVGQACGSSRYCDAGSCKDEIPCSPACPTGFKCSLAGICGDGNLSDLRLNLPVYKVSGTFTVNGAAPKLPTGDSCSPAHYRKLRVRFRDRATDAVYERSVHCESSGFPYSIQVPAGTYEVSVEGGSDVYPVGLPSVHTGLMVVRDSLTVVGDLGGQDLDLKVHKVSGTLTINGMSPPVFSPGLCTITPGDDKLRLYLRDKSRDVTYRVSIHCRETGYPFQLFIPPGTYEVTAGWGLLLAPVGFPYSPEGGPLVQASFTVGSDLSGQRLDLKLVKVSGTFKINGREPTLPGPSPCSDTVNPNNRKLTVRFRDRNRATAYHSFIYCDKQGFPFEIHIPPGTYDVSVLESSRDRPVELPTVFEGSIPTRDGLVVASELSGQILDLKTYGVSGEFTINGSTPAVDVAICNTLGDKLREVLIVHFYDKTRNVTYRHIVRCGDGFQVQIRLPPATYEVRVAESLDTRPLLFPRVVSGMPRVRDGLIVAGDLTGQRFDLKLFKVSGTFLMNGKVPAVDASLCSSTAGKDYTKLLVHFRDPNSQVTYYADIECGTMGFPFELSVQPATYDVLVREGSFRRPTDLPRTDSGQLIKVKEALSVASDLSGQTLDLPTRELRGTFTVNGSAPPPWMPSGCSRTSGATEEKLRLYLRDTTRNVTYRGVVLCKETDYPFQFPVPPGVYEVNVGSGSYQGPLDFPINLRGLPRVVRRLSVQ